MKNASTKQRVVAFSAMVIATIGLFIALSLLYFGQPSGLPSVVGKTMAIVAASLFALFVSSLFYEPRGENRREDQMAHFASTSPEAGMLLKAVKNCKEAVEAAQKEGLSDCTLRHYKNLHDEATVAFEAEYLKWLRLQSQ